MKNQALFSTKDKSKKIKCRLLQFLFGTLRVNWQAVLIQIRQFMLSHFILINSVFLQYFTILNLIKLG